VACKTIFDFCSTPFLCINKLRRENNVTTTHINMKLNNERVSVKDTNNNTAVLWIVESSYISLFQLTNDLHIQ
jgi:hypothetical protein